MLENWMILQGEQEEVVATHCDSCGCEIYEGDDYYDFDGDIMCDECMHDYIRDCRRTAERE